MKNKDLPKKLKAMPFLFAINLMLVLFLSGLIKIVSFILIPFGFLLMIKWATDFNKSRKVSHKEKAK